LFYRTHPAPTALYTLPLHDALPIWGRSDPSTSGPRSHTGIPKGVVVGPGHYTRSRSSGGGSALSRGAHPFPVTPGESSPAPAGTDRKSTRLNSSHVSMSYAVFCLKK